MQLLKMLLWISVFIVWYAYLGYGLLLWGLVRIKRLGKPPKTAHYAAADLPAVTFMIPSYNEEDFILPKIDNSLQLRYPREKISFLFVTDGSSDATVSRIKNYPFPPDVKWQLEHQPERRGKIAAVERVMPTIKTPITIYTDANTMLNPEAVTLMVHHFADARVGAVAGEKRIAQADKNAANAAGEGIYWKYESKLKQWDSEFHTVVGAAGELFAIRTDLYRPVEKDTLVEDFVMTMRIAQRGYKVVYEPHAYAVEGHSANMKEEMKRKVRIAAGGLQAVYRLAALLNPFRYGWLSFQYISHRVLRWTLAPLALPIIFVSAGYLAMHTHAPIYQALWYAQLVFYTLAFIGYLLAQRELKIKAFFIPYYFCMMNIAVYKGLVRLLRGQQSVVWEKAKRAT